jgi:hypothetical protein
MTEFEIVTIESLEINESQIEARISQIEAQLSSIEAQLSSNEAQLSSREAQISSREALQSAANSRNSFNQSLLSEINPISIILQPLCISEEQQNCVICIEKREKDEICSFNCKHTFCKICIESMILKNINISCPLCRIKVLFICTQKEEIQQIFNEICL